MKQRKSNGNQVFNVPNTPEGLEFIKLARKFLHKSKNSIKLRGRGSRKEYEKIVGKYTANAGLSQPYAQFFAVYINKNKKDVVQDWATIQTLMDEVNFLKNKLEVIKTQAYNIYNS